MGDIGNLQLGDINRKKEEVNKAGGINTKKSVFQTSEKNETDNPYSMPTMEQPYMSRVEGFVNNGPLMQTRIHTQNSNDIAFSKKMEKEKAATQETATAKKEVRSEETQNVIKARSELKVFSGDVMKKGAFTFKAKEAARHFFKQVTDWAGSFDDGGSGFYGSMGISSVVDCLYVDGMSLRNYLKEQFYYKTTGNPVQDQEAVRNYLALLAARGEHVITLVRPNVKGNEAEVKYKNLDVDLTDVGSEEARKSRALKEKGNQVRSNLKKRIDKEMTERTGMAYRKAYGCETDGFDRLEGAKAGLKEAGEENSEAYKSLNKSFEHYNYGLQKLGLKPGRDDISAAVAFELKDRCEKALKAANDALNTGDISEKTKKAIENTKKALEVDLKLYETAISNKLSDDSARMRLDELLDSGADDKPDKGGKPDEGDDGDNNDQGSDDTE